MGWIDKCFKKRLERVCNNYVLNCNIAVKGYIVAEELTQTGSSGNTTEDLNKPKHDNLSGKEEQTK